MVMVLLHGVWVRCLVPPATWAHLHHRLKWTPSLCGGCGRLESRTTVRLTMRYVGFLYSAFFPNSTHTYHLHIRIQKSLHLNINKVPKSQYG